ncbi:acyl-CoA N-acyltransferase [Mycena pura]|uniref:Acyl-CoA N-acyltransferase n=1 Tax=Mycena pura TaxID=153505 RepID=A0AAD6UYF3_9AGAR|nr:acyl-CoA N-acyltransferase [Mycena pura]
MTPPHDVNFCFPVPPTLQNGRVKLVPFIPSEHADAFFAVAGTHPELFEYLPWGPFATTQDFVSTVIEQRIQPDRGMILFAVFDTSAPGEPQLAGTIGLLDTSPANLSTEIGFVITLPQFQRTHVTSNAAGLLLRWTLNGSADGGLSLRRIVWRANFHNNPSVRTAERLGFRQEGVLRWERVLPVGRTEGGNGGGIRAGDPKPDRLGRDTVQLSLCWDDWEAGARESVKEIMHRVK